MIYTSIKCKDMYDSDPFHLIPVESIYSEFSCERPQG